MSKPSHVSADELSRRVGAGDDAVIIDVRSAEEYRTLHAAGARSLPLERVDQEAVAACVRDAGGVPHTTVYFICHSGRRAVEACARVLERFPGACVVDGGTLAWAQAGLPVHHGEEP